MHVFSINSNFSIKNIKIPFHSLQINLYSTAFRIKHQIIILVKQEKKKKTNWNIMERDLSRWNLTKGRKGKVKAALFFSCVNTQLWLHKHLKHQKMRNPWVSLCKWYKSKQKQNLFTEQITLMMLYGLHLTHLWRLEVLSLFHRSHIHFVAVFTFQSEALLRHLPEY